MRDSEKAIKEVQEAFDDYRQSHDYLNDMITVWAKLEDGYNHDAFKAQWPKFMILFYEDRIVFKYAC